MDTLFTLLLICLAVLFLSVRDVRRKAALNETLHELRRPLQALALALPGPQPPAAMESSLDLVGAALERLECEINGRRRRQARVAAAIPIEPLLHSAAQRWGGRVALRGGSLAMEGGAPGAAVRGDRFELSQAIDTLIDNAIVHGGPAIVLSSRCEDGSVRLRVADSGRRPAAGRRGPGEPLRERLRGRRLHGHGLTVVRRTAAAHGGSFALTRSADGAAAVIELPAATS